MCSHAADTQAAPARSVVEVLSRRIPAKGRGRTDARADQRRGHGQRRRRDAATADDGRATRSRGCGRLSDEARGRDRSDGLDAQTDQPVGIITEADTAHAVAGGKDVNSVRIYELMTTRPTVIKTTTNLDRQTKDTRATVRQVGAGLEKELKKEVRQTFRQLEALQNLSAVLPANDVLPATRVWAASPDLLLVLVDLVIAERPSLVVECGSGASTLWLALAMRRFGIDGRIIALDHDPVFGRTTRGYLARHDVADLAEVRDAPLESFSLGGETYSWYARRAWEDLKGIDLLFVDGPPATTGHQARYPALPLLAGALSPVATAVLDDLIVPDMQKVLRLWLDAYPDFDSEILPLEKQAAVLRRS
jgi:predicted O-methyltransferase YrrM